jgi:hypothetical protein
MYWRIHPGGGMHVVHALVFKSSEPWSALQNFHGLQKGNEDTPHNCAGGCTYNG